VKSVVVTGGTGHLGAVVVPRLEGEYEVTLMRRGANPPLLTAPVHGLVMLAGSFAMGNAWESMIDANVMSAARAIDAIVPHIAEGGRVIAISAAVTLTSPPGIAAYSASKSALNGIIKTLANELAPRKITANALLPPTLDATLMNDVAEWIAFLLSERSDGVTGQLIVLSGAPA
jgi:NAD(P)-dependent dehydrogenase (short-subunit alcohol dehydrogenase family)